MKITIHITKEILKRSKYCSIDKGSPQENMTGQNCAISCAIVELFGTKSWVNMDEILFFKQEIEFTKDGFGILDEENFVRIPLPENAIRFINIFDFALPEERITLPEISFNIDIPEEVIDLINIDEVKRIIEKSDSLSISQLV